jgi:hypothetical protein
MEQSPSWEAHWFAASQEIPRVLWNPKVHHRTHFRSYLHKMNKRPSPNCNCPENAIQTARHLLSKCSIFSKDRPPVLKSLPPPLVLEYHTNTVSITRFLRSIFKALQEESTGN